MQTDDLFAQRGPRFWWEYSKLVIVEWWLRVVLRRHPALCECGDHPQQ